MDVPEYDAKPRAKSQGGYFITSNMGRSMPIFGV